MYVIEELYSMDQECPDLFVDYKEDFSIDFFIFFVMLNFYHMKAPWLQNLHKQCIRKVKLNQF